MTNKKVETGIKGIKERLSLMRPIDAVLSPVYLLKNYGMDLLGFDLLSRQMDKSIDEFHSPKAKAKILKDNVAGIKTSYLNEHVKKANQSIGANISANLSRATTGFETLLNALDPLPAAGDPSLPRLQQRRNLLTRAQTQLQITRGLSEELTLFKLRMETLQDLLEKNAVDNPRVIVGYIKEQYDKALEQLKLKKTADLNKVDEEMATLRARNMAVADGTYPFAAHEIAALEAALKKDINEAYEKAEKGLDKDFKTGTPPDKKDENDKGVPGLLGELDKAVTQAEAELHNFVLFSEKSKSKTLLESNLSAGLGTGAATNGRVYREISFEDYAKSPPEYGHSWLSPNAWFQYAQFLMNTQGHLSTPSGLRIEYSENGLNFTFPPGRSFYHHYQDRLLGADMMLMVNKCVEQGTGKIVLTLDCGDPELRKKIMEEFYYCAHLAGLTDDQIFFKISGCPQASNEDEKKPIDNKKASEIMGQLGNAPARAQIKKQAWEQERAAIEQDAKVERNRDIQALTNHIDDIIGMDRPGIEAVGRYIP